MAREAGRGKNTRTIFGPNGPILEHNVAFRDGDITKPMEDYGDEDTWDVDSFKNEGQEE